MTGNICDNLTDEICNNLTGNDGVKPISLSGSQPYLVIKMDALKKVNIVSVICQTRDDGSTPSADLAVYVYRTDDDLKHD